MQNLEVVSPSEQSRGKRHAKPCRRDLDDLDKALVVKAKPMHANRLADKQVKQTCKHAKPM